MRPSLVGRLPPQDLDNGAGRVRVSCSVQEGLLSDPTIAPAFTADAPDRLWAADITYMTVSSLGDHTRATVVLISTCTLRSLGHLE
jgi:hypothetical protein